MFYFSLAEKLGMTVAKLLSEIDSVELAEWAAYYKIKQEEESGQNKPLEGMAGVIAARNLLPKG